MKKNRKYILKAVFLFAMLCALVIVTGGVKLLSKSANESPAEENPASTQAPNLAAENAEPTKETSRENEERLLAAEDGFLLLDGYLYEVDSDGSIKTDFSDGMLSFGADGRYTSGDDELDAIVAALIVSQTPEKASRLERLGALYAYVRDNMTYVGFESASLGTTSPNGADGWGNGVAKTALSGLKGNCYYYNSAFTALARGLGYQAYIVTGTCGLPARPHCWCEIEMDGSVFYCDPELEWSRSVYQNEKTDIFFKDWTQTEGWSYQPNAERQTDAKKAEAQAKYDAMIEYAKAHPSPRVFVTPVPTATQLPAEPSAPVADTPVSDEPELPVQQPPVADDPPQLPAEPQPQPTQAPVEPQPDIPENDVTELGGGEA